MNSEQYIRTGVRQLVDDINCASKHAVVKMIHESIENNCNPVKSVNDMFDLNDDNGLYGECFLRTFNADDVLSVIDSDPDFTKRIGDRDLLSTRSYDSPKMKLNAFRREVRSELTNVLTAIAEKATEHKQLFNTLTQQHVLGFYQKELTNV